MSELMSRTNHIPSFSFLEKSADESEDGGIPQFAEGMSCLLVNKSTVRFDCDSGKWRGSANESRNDD